MHVYTHGEACVGDAHEGEDVCMCPRARDRGFRCHVRRDTDMHWRESDRHKCVYMLSLNVVLYADISILVLVKMKNK